MASVPMLGAWYEIFRWYHYIMMALLTGLVIFLIM